MCLAEDTRGVVTLHSGMSYGAVSILHKVSLNRNPHKIKYVLISRQKCDQTLKNLPLFSLGTVGPYLLIQCSR